MNIATIKSRSRDYPISSFSDFGEAVKSCGGVNSVWLVCRRVLALHPSAFAHLPPERIVALSASEKQKSFAALEPVMADLAQRGLTKSGGLVVVGGGTIQDVGCFIASVLFRGLPWQYIPTTLLSQADSCVGGKSAINLGALKNQVGTFHPPRRVVVCPSVLLSLSREDIRSGMGEILKIALMESEMEFLHLMGDLAAESPAVWEKWVVRAILMKQRYVEEDEFDGGIRNLLNYGHTFGHAYEAASGFAIPHGIAVTLGCLTATFVSMKLGMVVSDHYSDIRKCLAPWHVPFGDRLKSADFRDIADALWRDKKNSGGGKIGCILTRGFCSMERASVPASQLLPILQEFISREI